MRSEEDSFWPNGFLALEGASCEINSILTVEKCLWSENRGKIPWLRAGRVCLHNSCSSGKSLAAHGWNWKIVFWQQWFGFGMNVSLNRLEKHNPKIPENHDCFFFRFFPKPFLVICFLRGTFIHASIANTVRAWGFIRKLPPPQSVRSLVDPVKQGEVSQMITLPETNSKSPRKKTPGSQEIPVGNHHF